MTKLTIKNDRLLRALKRQANDRPPVWLMRQAGRYMPEYRQVREKAGDFMSLCRNPELCCEVAMQPIDRFNLDAAILFSDILTIPDAMGLGLSFAENQGPQFARRVESVSDIDGLPVIDPEASLGYVSQALRTTKSALGDTIPLIGFSGSPWTLATYMIEGGSSRTFPRAKALIYCDPQAADKLLKILATNVIEYLKAQIEAGADAVMIFDTWGGVLTHACYLRFSLAPMQHIVSALKTQYPDIPIVLFTKGGCAWLEDMAETGADGLGLDWTCDLGNAFKRVGDQVALQGNLDPGALYGTEEIIRDQVLNTLNACNNSPGHIFNLGHGIEPGIDPEKVKLAVDTVLQFRYQQ